MKVFIRVRPMMRSEIGQEQVISTDMKNLIKVSDTVHNKESTYNQVFD